jgi:peptide/nickel transport system substrate-binding protein
MRIKSVISCIGLILALCGGFIAVQPAFAASTLVVGVESPPKSMNPHSENGDATLGVMTNIFDGLMQRQKTDGKLIPALAEKYEHPDPLTWKFYLRKGVKFHNGNPFTAADVKYTFERLINPEVSQFVSDGKAIASIETPDDYTVIVKTKDPIPWFIDNMHQVFIMDKESSESRSEGDIGVAPIGTGAYKVTEYVKGSHLKLEANPTYWEGAPPIKNVEMKFITEPSTRFAALASGQTELINGVPVELIDKVKENKNLDVMRRPARRAIFLVVTNRPGTPTADPRVRKAMSLAINEDEIIKKLMRGQATAASQMVDPPTVGYNPDIKRLAYNVQEAKKLLKEAGLEKGFEITLAGPNDRYVMDKQICEAVAKYLAKVGIKVNLDVKPKSIYFTEVMENKHDFYMMGWFDGTYSGARTFFRHLHTIDKNAGFGDWNGSRSSDQDIDQVLEKTNQIVDKAQYVKTLQEANKMAMERVRVIPLHYQMDLYAVAKKNGLQFTPRPDQWFVFKDMSKK